MMDLVLDSHRHQDTMAFCKGPFSFGGRGKIQNHLQLTKAMEAVKVRGKEWTGDEFKE